MVGLLSALYLEFSLRQDPHHDKESFTYSCKLMSCYRGDGYRGDVTMVMAMYMYLVPLSVVCLSKMTLARKNTLCTILVWNELKAWWKSCCHILSTPFSLVDLGQTLARKTPCGTVQRSRLASGSSYGDYPGKNLV